MSNACANEEQVHTDFADTGERDTNQETGTEFQIWKCACGERQLEVFPR